MSEDEDHKQFLFDGLQRLLDTSASLHEEGREQEAEQTFLATLNLMRELCCTVPGGPVMLPNGSIYFPLKLNLGNP